MENLYKTNCIRTFTGIYMNVFDPTLEMICIEDIAHALSNQCRFGGHLPEFYSVAQHSILCSKAIDNEYKLQALLHDASEAYLLDIQRPIKQGLSNYKEIEDKLMNLIAEKFGFKYPLEKPVKQIDERMLQFEWEHLMLQKQVFKNFVCWSPGYAKRRFLETYAELIYQNPPESKNNNSCKIDNWGCPYHDCMSDRCAHQQVTEVNKCDFGDRFCSIKDSPPPLEVSFKQ